MTSDDMHSDLGDEDTVRHSEAAPPGWNRRFSLFAQEFEPKTRKTWTLGDFKAYRAANKASDEPVQGPIPVKAEKAARRPSKSGSNSSSATTKRFSPNRTKKELLLRLEEKLMKIGWEMIAMARSGVLTRKDPSDEELEPGLLQPAQPEYPPWDKLNWFVFPEMPPAGGLLRRGFDPYEEVNTETEIPDELGQNGRGLTTAIRQAALFNRLDCVRFLMKNGGAINCMCSHTVTDRDPVASWASVKTINTSRPEVSVVQSCPLMASIMCGHVGVVSFLIEEKRYENYTRIPHSHYTAAIQNGQPLVAFELMGVKFRNELSKLHPWFKHEDLAGVYPDLVATCSHSTEKKFDSYLGLDTSPMDPVGRTAGPKVNFAHNLPDKHTDGCISQLRSITRSNVFVLPLHALIDHMEKSSTAHINHHLVSAERLPEGAGVLFVNHALDQKELDPADNNASVENTQMELLHDITHFCINHNANMKFEAHDCSSDMQWNRRNCNHILEQKLQNPNIWGDAGNLHSHAVCHIRKEIHGHIDILGKLTAVKSKYSYDRADKKSVIFTSNQRLPIEYVWIDFICLEKRSTLSKEANIVLAAAAISTHCMCLPKTISKKMDFKKVEDFSRMSSKQLAVSDWKDAFSKAWFNVKLLCSLLTGSQTFLCFELGSLTNMCVEFKGASLAGTHYPFLEFIAYIDGGGALYSGFEIAAGMAMKQCKYIHNPQNMWDNFLKDVWGVGVHDPCVHLLPHALEFYDAVTVKSKHMLKKITRMRVTMENLNSLGKPLKEQLTELIEQKLGTVNDREELIVILQVLLFVLAFYRMDIPWEFSSKSSLEVVVNTLELASTSPNSNSPWENLKNRFQF